MKLQKRLFRKLLNTLVKSIKTCARRRRHVECLIVSLGTISQDLSGRRCGTDFLPVACSLRHFAYLWNESGKSARLYLKRIGYSPRTWLQGAIRFHSPARRNRKRKQKQIVLSLSQN